MLYPKAKKKNVPSIKRGRALYFLLQSKLEIINSAYLRPLSKEINMVLSFKYPTRSLLSASLSIFPDYSASHYFNITLFLHRQCLALCKAEVAVSRFQHAQSNPINYWPEVTLQTTGRVFLGGLPFAYSSYKVRLFHLSYCILFCFFYSLKQDRIKSFTH